jgi:hypothetical protein
LWVLAICVLAKCETRGRSVGAGVVRELCRGKKAHDMIVRFCDFA